MNLIPQSLLALLASAVTVAAFAGPASPSLSLSLSLSQAQALAVERIRALGDAGLPVVSGVGVV